MRFSPRTLRNSSAPSAVKKLLTAEYARDSQRSRCESCDTLSCEESAIGSGQRRRFQNPLSPPIAENVGPSVPVALDSASDLSSDSDSESCGSEVEDNSPPSKGITRRNASISACTRARSCSFCCKTAWISFTEPPVSTLRDKRMQNDPYFLRRNLRVHFDARGGVA